MRTRLEHEQGEITDLGTVIWNEYEYDQITHIMEESQWTRFRDFWGKTGWVIGFRDFVPAACKNKKATWKEGFGGEIMVKYDNGDISSLHESKVFPE